MNTQENNDITQELSQKVEIYWKDWPILRSLEVVTEMFSEMLVWIAILVVEEKSDAPSKALSLLKADPLKKMIGTPE